MPEVAMRLGKEHRLEKRACDPRSHSEQVAEQHLYFQNNGCRFFLLCCPSVRFPNHSLMEIVTLIIRKNSSKYLREDILVHTWFSTIQKLSKDTWEISMPVAQVVTSISFGWKGSPKVGKEKTI